MRPAVINRAPTQPQRVLALLRQGPQDTLALREHFVMSTSYVIHRLRLEGHVIHTSHMKNRVALYKLVREAGAA